MSYGIMAYAVGKRSVEIPFGSKDAELQQNITSQVQERFNSLDEHFGGTPMETIAEDYFAGEVNHPDDVHKYWYFAEILCQGYGETLPNNEWQPFRGATRELINYEVFNMFGFDTEPHLPAPDDFPTVFTVDHEFLDNAYAAIYQLHENEVYDVAQTMQFHSWVEKAKELEKDLVLFYY